MNLQWDERFLETIECLLINGHPRDVGENIMFL